MYRGVKGTLYEKSDYVLMLAGTALLHGGVGVRVGMWEWALGGNTRICEMRVDGVCM